MSTPGIIFLAALFLALLLLIRHNRQLQRRIDASQSLDQQLRLAADFFNHAQQGMMITDPQGTIINVNNAFTRMSGYGREEAIGQNPRLLSSGRHEPAFYRDFWQALLETGHWRGEIWDRRKNGEIFAEYMTVDAVRNEEGNIRHFVALFSDITEIKEQQAHLEHLAHFDPLTGLPNRLLFADRLNLALSQTERRGQNLALAYLDLDGFKKVNDCHGHALGDQLLIALTRRMKHALRESDTIARLGGDEFAVILTDLTDIDSTLPLLDRLLTAASETVRIGEIDLSVSSSIGVVFYPQTVEVDSAELLHQADRAMYQAKLAGKNRYKILSH